MESIEEFEMETTEIPPWLNQEYFRDILDREYKDYEVLKFVAEPALEKGENFASTLYLASITLKTEDDPNKDISYVIKALPEGEFIKGIIKNVDFFPKEIKMYCDIIPKFEALYRELGEDIKFAPKCFKSTYDPESFVMEDLMKRNFSTLKNQHGLNLRHVEKVLEKLGKFHAASACVHERLGGYSNDLIEGIYTPSQKPKYQAMYRSNFVVFKKCLLDYGLDKRHLNKLERSCHTFYDKLIESLRIDPDEFNVLNHGDLWINNIMFHHNRRHDIDEVYFVDFQVCKWGSPIQDLYSFLISSCKSEFRIKNFDFLIKYYHDHLVLNLKRLNYSKRIPTLIDLHCSLLKRGFFAVLISMGITAIALLTDNDKFKMDNLIQHMEDSLKVKEHLYSNPEYIKTIKQLFPFFENKGFFDI